MFERLRELFRRPADDASRDEDGAPDDRDTQADEAEEDMKLEVDEHRTGPPASSF